VLLLGEGRAPAVRDGPTGLPSGDAVEVAGAAGVAPAGVAPGVAVDVPASLLLTGTGESPAPWPPLVSAHNVTPPASEPTRTTTPTANPTAVGNVNRRFGTAASSHIRMVTRAFGATRGIVSGVGL
jgi:hypothetical protein